MNNKKEIDSQNCQICGRNDELLELLKLMLEENQETGYKYQVLRAIAKSEGK